MTSDVLHADNKPTVSMLPSLAILLSGAAIDAIAALFLAPQAGRESRKQLREYSRPSGETMWCARRGPIPLPSEGRSARALWTSVGKKANRLKR